MWVATWADVTSSSLAKLDPPGPGAGMGVAVSAVEGDRVGRVGPVDRHARPQRMGEVGRAALPHQPGEQLPGIAPQVDGHGQPASGSGSPVSDATSLRTARVASGPAALPYISRAS